MVRLIATDLDETLLRSDGETVSGRTRKANGALVIDLASREVVRHRPRR